MFKVNHQISTVTAILPNSLAREIISSVNTSQDTRALAWKARGTLLHDTWWKRFLPPISPVKTVIQMLVPNDFVNHMVLKIIRAGKLNKQAIGAVFSTPCDFSYVGSKFTLSFPEEGSEHHPQQNMSGNLGIIYCIVAPKLGERVAKAAINAGAHGYADIGFCQGRGIIDAVTNHRYSFEFVE